MTPVLLAHLGGVPEALTVAVPVVLLAAILYAGKRRERAERAAAADLDVAAPVAEVEVRAADPGDDVSR